MLQFFDYSTTNGSEKHNLDDEGHIVTDIDNIEQNFFEAIYESSFTKRLDQTINLDLKKAALPRSYCGAIFRVHKALAPRCLVLPTRKPLTLAGRCFEKVIGREYLKQETWAWDRGTNLLWSQDVVLTPEGNSGTLIPVSLPYSSGGLSGIPRSYFLNPESLGKIDNSVLIVFANLGNLTCPVARICLRGRGRDFDFDMRNVFSGAASLLVGYLGLASQNEMSSTIRKDFEFQWSEIFGA
jgi:hypothetical protein